MLTISRLGHRSINYYNETAHQAERASRNTTAGGGLAEYYSEGETRIPTWLVIGNHQAIADVTGLDRAALHGEVDTEVAEAWLDDGRAPTVRPGVSSPKRACMDSISPSPHLRACR